MSDGDFLAGYGAAKAMPGPLFSIAAYLGAVAATPVRGLAGAAIALTAISLPELLLFLGALPFWSALRTRRAARAAMRGVNAVVVGLLGAALYDPVWTSAVHGPAEFAVVAAAFVLLVVWRTPPFVAVDFAALAGAVIG